MEGLNQVTQEIGLIRILPEGSPALNPGFDVTPARLVSGLITEKGICEASEAGIKSLFDK
jgi:methylthioribose-1-phosphate isomerase